MKYGDKTNKCFFSSVKECHVGSFITESYDEVNKCSPFKCVIISTPNHILVLHWRNIEENVARNS